MLLVRLCGGLSLERDGVPLELPRSRRGRALLAWLALHPGMHARGMMAAQFWPEVLDSSARSSLRVALSELRAALGDDAGCLLATREAVGLDGARVDVREFSAHLAAGDPKSAVAACPGELLRGMDEDWVHAARAEHHAQAVAALAELADAAEVAGDSAAALAWSRQAAALDPLGEQEHRKLMRRLAAGGDRSGALRVGEQLGQRLRGTLGIAPAASTRALIADLRATPQVTPVPLPAPVVRAAEGTFVGRQHELARLSVLVSRPGRRLVVISGEPGIGKTRLALRAAATAPGNVLLGRCVEEPLGAFGPFAEALAQCDAAHGAAVIDALAGPNCAELTLLRDPGASQAGLASGARVRLFDAADTLLAGLAPVALVVDDLQWADRGTLLLLAALVRSPRDAALTILTTARQTTGALATTLAGLAREGDIQRIALTGLTAPDIAALTQQITPQVSPEAAATVRRLSGGNPFYAQELLRAGATGAVPESVREALAARRAQLDEAANRLLVQAATFGERVALPPLLHATELDETHAEAALDDLAGANLLRAAAGGVEFPHALVREAVLADLNPVRRARLHRMAAAALKATAPSQVEQIAVHLNTAGEPAQAVPFLEQAADRAMAMAAFEQAARYRADAVAALDSAHSPDEHHRGALLAGSGEALLHAGDAAGARVRFKQVTGLARRTRDAKLLARAALGAGGLGVQIADVDGERVGLLEEALHATADSDPATKSALLARLAVELYYAPDRDRSETLSAEAVVTAKASGDSTALASALNARHVALWRPDRLTQRTDVAREMIAAAQTARDPALQLQARNWLITDLFEAGDLTAWRAERARHAGLAEQLRLAAFTWYATLWEAVDELCAGNVEQATLLRERARAEGERAGDSNGWLFAEMLAFCTRLCTGDVENLDVGWVQDRIATSATGPAYRAGYSWALALTGHHDEAHHHLDLLAHDDFALLPFDANWMSAIGEAMEAARIVNHQPTAHAVQQVLAPYAGRPLTAGRAVQTYGSADRQLGHAAALLGDHDTARHWYERAIEIDDANRLWPWTDRARQALAQLDQRT